MFLLLSCPVGRGCVRCAGSGLVQSLTAITNLRPERWKRSQTAQKASPLWTNGSVVVLIPNQYNQYPSCKEVPWIVVVIGESVYWISPVQLKYYHSKTNPRTNGRLWMTLRSCVFFSHLLFVWTEMRKAVASAVLQRFERGLSSTPRPGGEPTKPGRKLAAFPRMNVTNI